MGFWEGPILDDIIALGGLGTRPKAGSGCCPIPLKKKEEILKAKVFKVLKILDGTRTKPEKVEGNLNLNFKYSKTIQSPNKDIKNRKSKLSINSIYKNITLN